MKKLLLISMLLTTPVFAQAPINEFTYKMTTEEINKVGAGLEKLPYGDVSLLIQKLRSQYLEQVEAAKIKEVNAPTPDAGKK